MVNQAWAQMSERCGVPPEVAVSSQRGFAVVAYGKLGGIRALATARISIWCSCTAATPTVTPMGRKPIDSRQFYLRLAQRIPAPVQHPHPVRHPLRDRRTAAPSGDSGLLVSSLSAYEQYQQQEGLDLGASGLVRARPIYGDDAVVAEFAASAATCWPRSRTCPTLAREVREMRHKMRDHLL